MTPQVNLSDILMIGFGTGIVIGFLLGMIFASVVIQMALRNTAKKLRELTGTLQNLPPEDGEEWKQGNKPNPESDDERWLKDQLGD